MSDSGIEIIGVSSVLQRLQATKNRIRQANVAATEEAIAFLEEKARAILETDVYGKHKAGEDSGEEEDHDSNESLLNSFKQEFNRVAGATVVGSLLNTSDHAKFIEDGTDREGSGQHFVPVGGKGFLAWMGADGSFIYSKKGHYVKGIKPVRFMARALNDHRAEVRAIFEKHLRKLG